MLYSSLDIYPCLNIKFKTVSLLFVVILIVFAGYRIFNPIYLYKKEVKKKAITKEKLFNFYFYDKYFKVRDNLNSDKIPYFSLYKVYETRKYFYLYLTKKYSFIIEKEAFTLGTSEEFSNFIKNKMWIKYSEYNKKTTHK